ncbi:MAG: hypothetical protein AB1445_14395 [Bacillota bacterium]
MWRVGVALLLLLCFLVWGLNTVERAMLRTSGVGLPSACAWKRQDQFLVLTVLGHSYRFWLYPTAALTHRPHQLILSVAGRELVFPIRVHVKGPAGR